MPRNILTKEFLKVGGTNVDGTAMTTSTGTYTSDALRPHFSSGNAALVIKTTAGSLAITYQVSDNGSDWYTPYDASGSTVDSLATNLTASTWIAFEPVPCEWMRIVMVLTGANSTVSAIYHQQERV